MDGHPIEDQRRFLRTPLTTEAKVLAPSGEIYNAQVVDLSDKGMALILARPIESSSKCAIAIELSTFPVRRLNVWARVVYCQLNEGASRIGMEFEDMDALSRDCVHCLTHGYSNCGNVCQPLVQLSNS